MLQESTPGLLPWYVTVDHIAQRAGLPQPPKRDELIAALRAQGLAAARSHAEPRGIKTSGSVAEVVRVAQRLANSVDE